MPLDVIYFTGGPREKIIRTLMDHGHRVTRVFVSRISSPDRVAATIEFAQSVGVPVEYVGRAELGALEEEVWGQLCLSAGFGYLFPNSVINAASLMLNVHGSLLPKYAGARTLNWAIESGEQESGVTIHQIDVGTDTGPILLQRSFPISPFDTGRSLYRKTLEFEPSLVLEALSLIEAGKAEFVSQPPHPPPLPDRRPEHSELDPDRPLVELFDAIRAADWERYPAYFWYRGEKVCIRLWRPGKPMPDDDLI